MTSIRAKGFQIFADKHGKVRCYHRATKHKVDLEKAHLGRAAFFAECERIRALTEALKATEPKPGTLGGLIAANYATEHFKETLSDRTRADYRKVAKRPSQARPSPPLIRRLWGYPC